MGILLTPQRTRALGGAGVSQVTSDGVGRSTLAGLPSAQDPRGTRGGTLHCARSLVPGRAARSGANTSAGSRRIGGPAGWGRLSGGGEACNPLNQEWASGHRTAGSEAREREEAGRAEWVGLLGLRAEARQPRRPGPQEKGGWGRARSRSHARTGCQQEGGCRGGP